MQGNEVKEVEMTKLQMEVARMGVIDGWPIDIHSIDINPPHFHFGPVSIGIPDVLPKSVSELRSYVFKDYQGKVTDERLEVLLQVIQGKTSCGLEMLLFMKDVWASFDYIRDGAVDMKEREANE